MTVQIRIDDDMSRCTAEEVARLLPLVSAQRREQALRYKHVFGQYCCLRSWIMVEELKGNREKAEGVKGEGMKGKWLYNEHGKPYWEGGPYFSISHCREAIVVAVDDKPIGIDVESIRSADDALIERTMNAQERELIGGDELKEKSEELKVESDRMFTRLWTQKEAVVKAQGTGITSFEQLQGILNQDLGFRVESVEGEKYIYSIAYKQ